MTGTLTLRAWECLAKTAGYYHRKLLATPQVSSFLKERYGFNKAIIRKYRIGYAENSGLIEHLSRYGFSSKEMTASGVFRPGKQNQSVIHPVFEDQVVFPFAFKDRTVFITALKQRWKKDFLFPEDQKLPIYDSRDRPWVAEGIDGKILYNQQVLLNQPDFLIITETIPDCITLDHHGFPAVTSTTGTIAEDDWEWIIPQLSGIRKIIFWHNNRIRETGWKSMLQAARWLSKEKISCLAAQPPLEEKQQTARERLRQYRIYPGISSAELRKNMEERSMNEYNEIQRLVAESETDVCSFFMSGKTSADFQRVLDHALLPVEFAVQFIKALKTLPLLLVEIGRQSSLAQDRLLKQLKKKTGERLISLRTEVKNAIVKDNDRLREEIERQRELGPPVLRRKNNFFYVKDNTIKKLSLKKTSEDPILNIQETANFHLLITREIINDDGEIRENGSTFASKTLVGEIVGKTWNKPFHIDVGDWGNNTRLTHRIFEQAGPQARCSTGAIDIIRSLSSILYNPPGTVTVYSCFGFHPTAGFVSPSLTIRQGKIIPTAKTEARVETGSKFSKARCLDLKPSSKKEVQKIIRHLLSNYLDFQAREITLPVLSHAFLGPFLFAMKLEDEFSPQILFLGIAD